MHPSDFAAFFSHVHGRPPFPWQTRLAEQVVSEGRWPNLLDLPTGVGKTSAIDVALFALAHRPDVFPRRIVLVVDRRVVVDQGAEHARKIRKRLGEATDGAAGAVAGALRALFGGGVEEAPFTVSVLRGGMPRDEAWAQRPDRPVVALSTVDQVGSRLLFRGYGVSPRMVPVHAGLLGNDALILLDEVQLSTAFADTLRALHRRWRPWHGRHSGPALPDRWGVVRMSATPLGDEEAEGISFRLDDKDRRHPVLAQRLGACKLTTTELVTVSGDDDRRVQKFAAATADAARAHVVAGAGAVAVVVNRVDTARRVHGILHGDARRAFDVALLTGRMRPLDRMDLLGERATQGSLASRIAAGRNREEGARPLVVVATQCIEAGADFDFDGMVTECASLDALRQRLGRLDRLGELGVTRCTVLARSDQVKADAEDPIYGGALVATWNWLAARAEGAEAAGGVDLGISGFPELPRDPNELRALCSTVVRAPILLPAHLDAWAQTNPRPEPDPDVALWLHGPRRDAKEVQIVWRADLDADDLNRETASGRGLTEMARELAPQLEICPPSSLESISVPIYVARAWLAGSRSNSFGDVEGAFEDDSEAPSTQEARRARRCVRLRRGSPEIVEARDLRPGDTLVVPSSYGGIGHGSWNPAATAFVPDLGDWAQLVHRGRPTLRLVPEVLAGPALRDEAEGESEALSGGGYWCSPGLARSAPRIPPTDDPEVALPEAIATWITMARDASGPRLRLILNALDPVGSPSRYRRIDIAGGRFALVARRRVDPRRFLRLSEDQMGDSRTEDDDSGSFADSDVTLPRHLHDVEEFVRRFAGNLGISPDLVSDLALAGSLHDVGKADRRFQRMLAGGNEVRLALQDEPLAKSSGSVPHAAAREQARRRSGYP
ncbi:MAG: type I-U CRISPR-associated helicase/endonuclease Cas3, partial [Longimicrobiales bacterium]|nr:type I-U CRISPR-associated helicase/endonuclease Cas3 [Longimicrobiales bacterium]